MNRSFTFVVVATTASLMGAGSSQATVGISASGNFNLPTTVTQHNGSQGSGFDINEGVSLDPGAGPWIKELVNAGPSVPSGTELFINETLTNTGTIPWTDWHEEILSVTGIPGAIQVPGFLFRNGSVHLSADYGAGLVGLAEGPDYTLQTMPYNGPPIGGNNNHWQAIWIFFAPHAVIQPGDTLVIEKRIFEVFGDGNIWQSGEFAEVAQYPTPEPTTLALGAPLLAGALLRRRSAGG